MNFSSDTSAPAHPNVLAALARVNTGNEASYGGDSVTGRLRGLLAEVFETEDFDFWMTASGTASNALALSCFCPPTGAVLCHAGAHIAVDERGAPEFFSGGGKLQLLGGPDGKIAADGLEAALARINHDFVHETPAHVLSLTNLTENGTAYSVAEVASHAAKAHAADLVVHLDGARFGNALVATGASPAEMSWKAGVDVLTFGLTKTGAMGCEIIMLFGKAREKAGELKARAKRSGHMPPKMRYLAAQAEAMLDGDLWLDLAARANKAALKLAATLMAQPGVHLVTKPGGNEVFARLPEGLAERLMAAGAVFYPWPDGSHRFVCSWATQDDEISAVATAMG
ncbi:MAG: threonine aldolase [Alphaproteobacteria bacterium]|uniref:threonine aldolase family protein n=1 Tax=Hyphomonas sp. TaxID=87 RepID=UPI001DF57E76|nr:threonine aldolase [Alphaproteobacteria bacterium]MBU2084136.1 threonine aldolase [Alphaproteobacteria bacterium]MBU2144329.1 threonine aldolase [Alphaproteobacteria bacterium]MBU2196413.1 threonine aldolase [Alphaproteobacteria bacterium]